MGAEVRKKVGYMNREIERLLDETGWQILYELQQEARLSYGEIGQRVGLTAPAVSERVRKLEEAGVITGYHAEVDRALVGLPVTAIIRMGLESSPDQRACNRKYSRHTGGAGMLSCDGKRYDHSESGSDLD